MKSTDELRKWARQFRCIWVDPHSGDLTYITNEHACPPSLDAVRLEDYVIAIADRIDAEHEREMNEKIEAIRRDVEEFWTRLPVDADGKPIHVGDWMTPKGMDNGFEVRQMHFDGEWSLDLRGFGVSQVCPDACHHHHAPTVEDVLHELIGKALMLSEIDGENELVAEYTAKLRLADDVEEQQ